MNKKIIFAITSLMLTGIMATASAFENGERSAKLYEDILNTNKQDLHLVVIQKIDMSEVLNEETYQNLSPAERVRYNRYEYNETKALCAERQTTFDGNGHVIKDVNTFAIDNKWYSVDYINKTYDRLPELLGMVKNFRDNFTEYFADSMPETGFDDYTGYDFDRRYKADKEVYFYFEKDTDIFKAYEISGYARYNIMELNDKVDMAKAFALPPEDFVRQPNEAMRNYATKLIANKNKKKK